MFKPENKSLYMLYYQKLGYLRINYMFLWSCAQNFDTQLTALLLTSRHVLSVNLSVGWQLMLILSCLYIWNHKVALLVAMLTWF